MGYGSSVKCDIQKQCGQIIWLGNVCPTKTRDNPNQGRVYDTDGIAPTLGSISGGNLQPMVLIERNNYVGFDRWYAETPSGEN